MGAMRLIAVGRLRKGEESGLFARFAERLTPPLIVTEIAEGRGSPAEVKRREGAALLAALPDPAFAIALDQGGITPDSEAFARELDRWAQSGKTLCFLIGGAEGLDGPVVQRADRILSLGPMTWRRICWLAPCSPSSSTARRRSERVIHTIRPAGRTDSQRVDIKRPQAPVGIF